MQISRIIRQSLVRMRLDIERRPDRSVQRRRVAPRSALRRMTVRRLTRAEARRIAVQAQLLDAERPPTCSTWSTGSPFCSSTRPRPSRRAPTSWRGAGSAPPTTRSSWSGRSHDRTLFEHRAHVRRDRADARACCARWPTSAVHGRDGAWPRAARPRDGWRPTTPSASDMLDLLRSIAGRCCRATSPTPARCRGRRPAGPTTATSPSARVPRRPRRGRDRRPQGPPAPVGPRRAGLPGGHADRARRRGARIRDERRLRSLGIARPRSSRIRRRRRRAGRRRGHAGRGGSTPTRLAQPFAGRTALLSPFDRLVHDRVRARLFDFEYVLEMYKPAAKRRWGYFALPVLHRDRLVGKLDAMADRKAGVLASTRSTRTPLRPGQTQGSGPSCGSPSGSASRSSGS